MEGKVVKVSIKSILAVLAIVIVVVATILTIGGKNVENSIQSNKNPEILRTMQYEQLTNDSGKIDNCDYIEFSAFFTKDLNGDGKVEKILGSCNNINSSDELYMDINVMSKGKFKDGIITIEGKNFNYSMNMVKDNVLKNTYISKDVTKIQLKEMPAGTQKLIIGNILPDIQNNVNNYTGISKITFTGTYVAEDGVTETNISKTVDLTVDWYGGVTAELYEDFEATTYYYDYNNIESTTLSMEFRIDDFTNELLLKENCATLVIPELSGYKATKVECKNDNVETQYDENTKVFTIKRSSSIVENTGEESEQVGKIINSLAHSNKYTIEITYPQEAFDGINAYTEIKIPIEGYYVAYNNPNSEFVNPYKSNIATGNITLVFRDTPSGDIYDFEVDFMEKTRVTRPDQQYVISKQYLIDMHNNVKEIKNKQYEVRWLVKRGIKGTVPSVVLREEDDESEETAYGDRWNKMVMDEYVSNIGIYFENADKMLGDNGKIFVYDNDTNELLKTFSKQDWNTYNKSNPYKYTNKIKHIRVETTNAEVNTNLMIYNVKELDVEKVLKDFTKEEVENVENVYTYLKATCNIEGVGSETITDVDYANYISDKSYANIRITNDKMETQTVYDNTIKIEAFRSQVGDAYWKNAMYIVELPEEIINMVINNISISRSDIEIIAYDLYKKDNKYFIKIITENEYEVSYSINIDCKLTIDPRSPSTEKTINLYAYNDNCDEYYYGTQDIYDVDSENNIEEVVGTSKTKVQFLSPTSLITLETISNYNDKNEVTVAPNVADIEKKRKKATVDIHLTNNYPNIVAGVKILGKIPFEGNTYILNSENLKSEFTATMTNEGVKIPEVLKNKVVVYYSTVENPTRDILDTANGWTLLENVDDFSKIRTYLIDLKGIEVKVGENYTFNYDVNIPQGIEYNTEAFCNHAVFFELKTDNGNLELKTEPNKVGIRIARKYDIEITKYKQNTDLVVPSCIYKLIELDKQGNEVKIKITTTDSNGKIIVKDIYVEKTYKLVEMKTTKEYSLNSDEIVFKLVENSENNLEFVQISEKGFASEVKISKNNEGKDVLVSSVENKSKYKVIINKIDKDTKSSIKDAYFMLQEKARTYVTDDNGIITIEGLEQDIEYTLVETKADGYYLLGETKFKLVKNEQGELVFECDDSIFSNVVIENTNKEHAIDINTVIENEKYLTCDIQILKVEESDEEITNNDELKLLQGAKFKLKSLDTEKEQYFTTDENGVINLSEIFVFEEKNNQITAEYLLQEVEAPVGYSNNAEQIKFRIIKNTEGNLEVDIMNASELNTFKSADVQDGLVRFIIEDKPLFNLIKVDEKTGEGLAGVEFVIYEINEDGSNLDFAKDANGKYVGNLNSDNLYVVVTGENGKVTLPLRNGKYKAIEVKTLEQYEELDRGYVFEVSARLNKQEVVMDESSLNVERDTELGLEITCIEDLVDFSLNIKNGTKTYDGELVKLTRTLDFLDDSSYNDSQTTKYGDLNGDGSEQGLKDELTNKSGCGFTPIGVSQGNSFKGTFDGQGFEIRNLYVKNNQYAGLFGFTVQAVVENIGVTGDVYGQYYTAGIVAKDIYTSILNSYSKVNIHLEETSSTQYAGGIVGEQYYNSIVYNCYNEGEIVVSDKKINAYIGGIVGTSDNAKIINSYNKGKIELSGYLDIQLGGILGKSSSEVINCHNYSDIRINRKDGGNGTYYIGGIVGNGGKITKSSNNGKIFNDLDRQYSYLYIGGIAGMSNEVTKSYNKGELHLNTTDNCDSYISGITYSYGSAVITDCYNSADIYNFQEGENMCNANVNGIGRGNINRCYNTGDIYNTADCNSYVTVYVNGIGYSCTIKNSYNTGDILNIATSNGAGINTYVAGVGVYGTISNCYNVGSLINTARAINTTSSASVRNGFISYGGTVNNCYYLDTVSISEGDNNTSGTKVTKEQLQSKEIYNQLNAEGVWLYYLDNMPKLDMIEQANIVGSFDLQIANTKRSFKITTDVLEVDGEKGGTITGDDTLTFEVVEYGSENTKEIKITKYKDYEIDEILVNGEPIEFKLDENGEYVIPAGYFKNIQEDIHIVAKFIPLDNLIIRKVDEDDNSMGLEGVKFRLEEKVKITPNKLIGEIQTNQDEEYTFSKYGSTYESTNINKSDTCSRSYFPIDLSNYSEKIFNLSVSYKISSYGDGDYGYCSISRSSIGPYSYENDEDFFVKVSGSASSSKSISLEGGYVYYLHIGYYKDDKNDSGDDKFTIRSINLECSDDLGYGYIPVSEHITNSDGIVSMRVDNVEYRLVEIESIYGYEKNYEPQEFTINEHEIKELVIKNKNRENNYTILKQDKETEIPIEGVKFEIYGINQNCDKLVYTGITDVNGELNLSLEPGYYKAIEIEAPNGYVLEEQVELRTTYFKVGEIRNDFEINYIEDLIDFSNDVNIGNNYQNNIVALKRTLDFNDDSCYKDPLNTTIYGDYNGDGVVQTIKEELTNTTGRGFIPIGATNVFNGIFEGNGYEIKNIYINNESYKFSGLFGEIHTAMICNLSVTGEINSVYSDSLHHGGIVGAGLNSLILNCNNKANISVQNSNSAHVGGIIGSGSIYARKIDMKSNTNIYNGNIIVNSYNKGNINAATSIQVVGGISGIQEGSIILNCFNSGNIEMNFIGNAGGILGESYSSNQIVNCYNVGNVSNGENVAGIVSSVNKMKNYRVNNCYNVGIITSNEEANIAGISASGGELEDSNISNSYWLNTSSAIGVCSRTDNTISMSEDEMKNQTFVNLLNNNSAMVNFMLGDTGYPVIDYEGVSNVQLVKTSKIKINNISVKDKYLKIIKKLDSNTNEPIEGVKFNIQTISNDECFGKEGDKYFIEAEKTNIVSGNPNWSNSSFSNGYGVDYAYDLSFKFDVKNKTEYRFYIAGSWFNGREFSIEIDGKVFKTYGSLLNTNDYSKTYIELGYLERGVHEIRLISNGDLAPIYDYFELCPIKILTTDEKGQISFELKPGYYKAIEESAPEEYVLTEDEELRTTYFKVGNIEADIEINYIEDLVDLSNDVINGNTYEDKTIMLARTLDFDDIRSYRDANDTTTYGDYNSDGLVQTIKEELTNTSSIGFRPIGGSNSFKGVFDGNGYEIQNIYINSNSYMYVGLFGQINDTMICNLGITGIINTTYNSDNYYVGGIAARAENSIIVNCYNKSNITGNNTNTNNGYTGGIIAYSNNNKIINCNNTGKVYGSTYGNLSQVGGIVGYGNNDKMINCYNNGNINAYSTNSWITVGGIVGYMYNHENIINCYNDGMIYASANGSKFIGGIVGYLSYIQGNIINKCYNVGSLNTDKSRGYDNIGSITGMYSMATESYWLNTTASKGVGGTPDYTQSLTEEEMKSEEFIKLLNDSNSVTYISGTDGYPVIGHNNNYINENISIGSEMLIKNAPKTDIYRIYTKVIKDVYQIEEGGNISGNGMYIYEVIDENENSSKDIIIKPDDGWKISYIKVNGEKIEFNENEDGTVLLDKFENVIEDKEIAVKFELIIKPNYILKKVDKETNEPIQGVEFDVKTIYGDNCLENKADLYFIEAEDTNIVSGNPNWSSSSFSNGYGVDYAYDLSFEFNVEKQSKYRFYIAGSLFSGRIFNLEVDGKLFATYSSLVDTTSYSKTYIELGVLDEGVHEIRFTTDGGYAPIYDYFELCPYIPLATNENGEISLELEPGYYKAIEKNAPEGYIFEEDEDLRTTYFKVGDIKADFEINYIEDLLDFSNNVNSGNYYENKIIELNRNLDFNNSSCYRNATDTTTYGDYNGDGVVKTIKEELTNTSGRGFKTIGRSYRFKGLFDGNGYEIQNIYINESNYSYIGLFGQIDNAIICNLGITGTINNKYSSSYSYSAGIACRGENCLIINCYNKANVTGNNTGSRNAYAGGILAYGVANNKLINCYNKGNISGTAYSGIGLVGGIVGYSNNNKVLNCYNEGNINAYSTNSWVTVGGITADSNDYEKIVNCYNSGIIYSSAKGSKYTGGISGRLYDYSTVIMNKCYNVGKISTDTSRGNGYLGAITAYYANNVTQCYWLNTTATRGVYGTLNYTQSFTEQEMKIDAFVKLLNNNNDVTYVTGKNGYPEIEYNNFINGNISNGSGILIKNSYKTEICKITTKVVRNSTQREDGGTVSGNGLYAYEMVNKNEDSIKDILIEPDDGWEVGTIKVNKEVINFISNSDGKVLLDKFNNVNENKEIEVQFIPIVENVFTLTKIDEQTNEPLQGIKFAIYNINAVQDFAKDKNNVYIGEKDKNGIFVVTTDENGEIKLNLPGGKYKAVEIEGPENYYLSEDEEERTTYFRIKEKSDIEINYIEDLVDLSNNNLNGVVSSKTTVSLARTLDFNDERSYRDANNKTRYGDYNGDGKIQTIKEELTNRSGSGFKAIGNWSSFSGTFNGCGYEINNFYNNYNVTCLFRYVSGRIINLGTSGDITVTQEYALINEIENAEVENCYSKTNITIINSDSSVVSAYSVAGLVYVSNASKIVNCYNKGDFYAERSYIAGIVNECEGTEILNCFNGGNFLLEIGGNVGGIALKINDKTYINNCHNSGNIQANGKNDYLSVGGIVAGSNNECSILNCSNKGNMRCEGNLIGGGIVNSASNTKINNCYNEGEIITRDFANPGGIANSITINSEVYNCYNTGNILCPSGHVAGICTNINNSTIVNCYNLGSIVSNNGQIAGIVQNYNGSLIVNCYNAGDLQSLGETGGIIQYYSSGKLTNNYYLNSSAMQGIYGQVDQPSVVEAKSKNYMKSQEFVELLNNNKNNIETSEKLSNWVYKEGEYPTLDLGYKLKGVTISEYINPMEFETVDSAITITNSKKSEVIIHHYLEGTGAEYNSEPVKLLEDEVVVGRINHPYTSVPKLEIEGYVLSTDENGEYIIPENASGTFTEETQHIYYYYNVKRYELTVQYYIEGTEEKITEDSKYHLKENEHYKIEPSEDVLLMYELVSVIGDEEKDITQNEVVTYYLKKKIAKITTKVEIPENELENGRTEKGGTILGEEEEVYESIPYGENSTKEISAMPDASYRLNSITVNGEQVPYTIENGKIYISKFENIIGDKEVVVKFEPIIGKVITHHYIQGTSEKLYEDIIVEKKIGEIVQTNPVAIDNYKLVGSEGNKDENGNVVITKEISEGIEEIIYYYQRSYIITTDVIEHNETYKDGTIKEKVKGGSITNEDVVIHEQVMKYDSNTKTIEMKPDEGYEISEIKVNGSIVTSELQVNDDGTVVIKEGYFTNIQSDIHVEVEYRKKTKVIVKYLDKETESEIISNTEILGYEGKEFETTTKTIVGYKIVKIPVSENSSETIVKVTDENNELTETKGTMISEDIIIAYWYEKIDAYVIERHIEINEKGEEIEIDCILYNDDTVNSVKTERKTYDKYISADAPEEVKENINNNYTNVKIIGKDENSYTASVDLVNTNEVWYYYIKQYNITTEVKPHKEVIDGNEVEVNGGTISKEYELDADGKEVEIVYEVVNSRGNSKKEIKMIPDNYYRIKSVMVNDNQIYIDNMIAEDGSLTIPAEYFKDVQKDYHIVVEYEKIPAKVIVKYIDEYTKESILPDKIIDGFVNDEYNEARVEIDSYIPAEPEPENTKGRMTKDNIVITYYYCKQYKITTDVIEHLEDEEKGIVDVVVEKLKAEVDALNNDNKVISDIKEDAENKEDKANVLNNDNKVTSDIKEDIENKEDKANVLNNDNKVISNIKEDAQNKETKEKISKLSDIEAQGGTVRIIPEGKKLVKGGTIQGEDEEPYETVSRGKDNIKEILIKPDDGYRIKSLIIKDGENEYNLSVKDYLTKDKTIIIPVSYFKNMQADKHVMVEFEQIPAKVIVNYLDIATKDSENPNKVSISESGEGFVNDDYKTYEKGIPYYELVKGQLPKNKEGKLTEEDTIVNYWYRKLLFNMKVTKEFSSIQMNGNEMLGDDKKFAKLDIVNTELNSTSILVKYKVSVTNTHEIEGTARIVENIPVGLIYEDVNVTDDKVQDVWKQVNGKLELITRTLKPGETAEYELVFKWDENLRCIGQLVSVVNIKETNNLPKFEETTLLDNQDMCTMMLVIRTGENRNIKMIISMCCFALAGVCTMIYIGTEIHYRKKKE